MKTDEYTIIICRDCGCAQVYRGGDTVCPNCDSSNVYFEEEEDT